jgi:hypothetical protein
MGNPKLVYSPIQLLLANQDRIFPIGWLENVEVDLAKDNIVSDFKVIDNVDDRDSYLTFWLPFSKTSLDITPYTSKFMEKLTIDSPTMKLT